MSEVQDKMLKVNIRGNHESMQSEVSSISKCMPKASLLQKAAKNTKLRSQLTVGLKVRSPENTLSKNLDLEIWILEGVYTPKVDHLFPEFTEESTEELTNGLNVNKPLYSKLNSMNLKQL